MKTQYYDGTELLSQRDINGEQPDIYICTTNRTGGKTTYFGRLLINRFLKKGQLFAITYRYDKELKGVSKKFFNDIGPRFFKGREMTDKLYREDGFAALMLDGNLCGFALALNNADKIKKISHLFSGVQTQLIDEFQSETNRYCLDEVQKFRSIHTSIARGQGKQVRRVETLLVGNPVTMLNPYYNALNIASRLNSQVRFLRGEGWVLEQGYVESAAVAQKESAFNRAFGEDAFNNYMAEGVYLNDDSTFIEKPAGKNKYVFTIAYMVNYYGLYEYEQLGIMYCSKRANRNYPITIAVTTADHNINHIMLQKHALVISQLRELFMYGAFRFADMESKEAILKMLSFY